MGKLVITYSFLSFLPYPRVDKIIFCFILISKILFIDALVSPMYSENTGYQKPKSPCHTNKLMVQNKLSFSLPLSFSPNSQTWCQGKVSFFFLFYEITLQIDGSHSSNKCAVLIWKMIFSVLIRHLTLGKTTFVGYNNPGLK